MAISQLDTVPRDPYKEFLSNRDTVGVNNEKAAVAVVDFKNRPNMIFNDVSGAASPRFSQELQVDPNGPDHARALTIQPDLMQKMDMTQAMLQDRHYAGLCPAKSDVGYLGQSCAQVASEFLGALSSPQPVDYAQDPMLQQRLALNELMPRPAMGGLL